MNDSSDNLRPPFVGPQWPVYPQVCQVCRVYGSAIAGSWSGSLYSAYVQQWGSQLTIRDREACYVWFPSGTPAVPNYFVCRLVSQHPAGDPNSLPLYIAQLNFSLTVEEYDGAPSVTNVVKIQFNQSDGLSVTDLGGGVALVGLTGAAGIITGGLDEVGFFLVVPEGGGAPVLRAIQLPDIKRVLSQLRAADLPLLSTLRASDLPDFFAFLVPFDLRNVLGLLRASDLPNIVVPGTYIRTVVGSAASKTPGTVPGFANVMVPPGEVLIFYLAYSGNFGDGPENGLKWAGRTTDTQFVPSPQYDVHSDGSRFLGFVAGYWIGDGSTGALYADFGAFTPDAVAMVAIRVRGLVHNIVESQLANNRTDTFSATALFNALMKSFATGAFATLGPSTDASGTLTAAPIGGFTSGERVGTSDADPADKQVTIHEVYKTLYNPYFQYQVEKTGITSRPNTAYAGVLN